MTVVPIPPHKLKRYTALLPAQSEDCSSVQAPAPRRPIDRGLAGPGIPAHVLVSKYLDDLPLNRQSQIYKRDELDLSTSTLCD